MKKYFFNRSLFTDSEDMNLRQKSTRLSLFYPTIINKLPYVIIFTIFLLSVLAMVNGIAVKSLLYDEATFALHLDELPSSLFSKSAPCAPLFYYSSYFMVSILGKSEWVYRLIPFISAMLGLALMIFFLLKLKYFSKFTSVITIFLLSTSIPLIHYAGNAHPYATDFFCSAALLVTIYQYFQKFSNRYLILYLILSFFCIGISFPALSMRGSPLSRQK